MKNIKTLDEFLNEEWGFFNKISQENLSFINKLYAYLQTADLNTIGTNKEVVPYELRPGDALNWNYRCYSFVIQKKVEEEEIDPNDPLGEENEEDEENRIWVVDAYGDYYIYINKDRVDDIPSNYVKKLYKLLEYRLAHRAEEDKKSRIRTAMRELPL
jgi:hypothetical protein